MNTTVLTRIQNVFLGENAQKTRTLKVQQGDYNNTKVFARLYKKDENRKAVPMPIDDATVTVVFDGKGIKSEEYATERVEGTASTIKFSLPKNVLQKAGEYELQFRIYQGDSLTHSKECTIEVVSSPAVDDEENEITIFHPFDEGAQLEALFKWDIVDPAIADDGSILTDENGEVILLDLTSERIDDKNVDEFTTYSSKKIEERLEEVVTKNEEEIESVFHEVLLQAKESGEFNGRDGEPGEDGTDGRSAYQYAVDGGYAGTEEDFAKKLAEENLLLDETLKKAGYAADAEATGKAFEEVMTSIKSVLEELKALKELIEAGDVQEAIAVLDEAILDYVVLA